MSIPPFGSTGPQSPGVQNPGPQSPASGTRSRATASTRVVRGVTAVAASAALFGLAACSGVSGEDEDALTLYSGQHESLANELAQEFEDETGITVDVRTGKDGELANQIIEEGDKSKADVFITEEPGPIGDVAAQGLLETVPEETLAKPDERFVPSDESWLPWAARSRVMYFSPDQIEEDELPDSILDLTDPEWKDRFAYAPSGAFKSTTAYLINTIGEEETLEWLEGVKENGVNEQKNGKVRDSVEAGQHEFGLSNHYYWYIMAKDKGGQDNVDSEVHYLRNDDAGALMLASGAGALTSSDHPEEAQQFLDWLVDRDGGQQAVATASPQFPLVEGVESEYGLPAIDELTFPTFDQGTLNNVDEGNDLLKQAGII